MTARKRGRGTRGSADVLGLVLVAPIAIALALLVVFISRQVDARAQVQAAAEAGAQAAAQERSAHAAVGAAERAVDAALADSGSCEHPTASIDTSAFRAGGSVTVSVTCTVAAGGLAAAAPAAELSARATAVIDRFRSAERGT